jgi:hypothetical protein
MFSRHSILYLALLTFGSLTHGETLKLTWSFMEGPRRSGAACTAVKFGKSVALAEAGQHIGGLTSGGLGRLILATGGHCGFSREFYKRLGKYYNKAEAWTFAPSAAEKELRALLSEHKIVPKFNQRLAKVKREGARIVEISMEDGTVYLGRSFIDTTYEGD